MDEITSVFIQECREQLAEMEAGLLRLEQDPSDNDNLNAIFRAAHTIKGGAGVVECHFIRHLLLPRSPIVSAFRRRLFFACEQFLLSSTLRSAVERTLHGYGGTGYVGIANIGLFHFHFLPSGEFLNRLSCCVKEGLADLVARKFSGKVLRNHLPAGSKNSLLMSHLPSARTRLSSLLPASVKLSAR